MHVGSSGYLVVWRSVREARTRRRAERSSDAGAVRRRAGGGGPPRARRWGRSRSPRAGGCCTGPGRAGQQHGPVRVPPAGCFRRVGVRATAGVRGSMGAVRENLAPATNSRRTAGGDDVWSCERDGSLCGRRPGIDCSSPCGTQREPRSVERRPGLRRVEGRDSAAGAHLALGFRAGPGSRRRRAIRRAPFALDPGFIGRCVRIRVRVEGGPVSGRWGGHERRSHRTGRSRQSDQRRGRPEGSGCGRAAGGGDRGVDPGGRGDASGDDLVASGDRRDGSEARRVGLSPRSQMDNLGVPCGEPPLPVREGRGPALSVRQLSANAGGPGGVRGA